MTFFMVARMTSGVTWADGLPTAEAAGGASADWAEREAVTVESRRMANRFMGIELIVL